MNLDVPGREWSRAGKRLEQHRSLGGNASKYKMAPKKRRTENPAHKDFLWRAGMLVRAVQQLGESRALLKERQNEIWVSLSGHSKRAIRFFDVAAMRFVRGRA